MQKIKHCFNRFRESKYNNKKCYVLTAIIFSVLVLFIILVSVLTRPIYHPPNFDLHNWELDTPIASGDSIEIITPDELGKGYASEYFYGDPDGSMVFSCPLNGAHTHSSPFPRSELRELAAIGDWDCLEGTHILNVTCRVTKVPGDADVIIGQIHGNDETQNPQLVKLYWNNDGTVSVKHKLNTQYDTDFEYVFGKFSLGDKISYILQLVNGTLMTSVTHSSSVIYTYTYTDQYWNNQNFYFKAGNYLLDTSILSDNSVVKFYALSTTHII